MLETERTVQTLSRKDMSHRTWQAKNRTCGHGPSGPNPIAALLLLGLITATGCGEKKTSKAATAPQKGVVGTILTVRGKVTYSLEPGGERKPLTQGMNLMAEWTVHTGPQAGVTARLSNGHRWNLAGGLSKRVSKISALTLAPVKVGAVAQLSDLGARGGKDRSAAAGLHQERAAAGKASPSKATPAEKDLELDEIARPAAAPTPAKDDRREPARTRVTRAAPKRPTRRAMGARSGVSRLYGVGRGGGTTLGRHLGTGTSVRRAPRPAPRPRASGKEGLSKTAPVKPSPARLTRAQLNRVLGPARARLTGCLKKHKVTTPLAVLLVIRGTNGRVSTVRVKGRPSGDAVVRCLLTRARALRFPRFSAATQTTHAIRLKAP